ncbi:MAG: PhnD/SsuA/transferrin family substrate-binding protein [Pseudomonadota bacterium]
MYDFASVREATDRYWHAIRTALGQGPQDLCRDLGVWEAWARPDLLLSQTCGVPFRSRLHGTVTLIGTPDYGLPQCGPGEYNSVFVVRADDPRDGLADFDGACIAVNSQSSQSGWAGPIMHARAKGIRFGKPIKSGAHAMSAEAVASGAADIAALDALSWHFIQRETAFAERLRVIDTTTPTPGLPYITKRNADAETMFDAVKQAIADLSEEDRRALSLKGIVRIPTEAYLSVPTPAPPSFA